MRSPIIAVAFAGLVAGLARRPLRVDRLGSTRDSTVVDFVTREGTRLAFDVSPRDGSIAFDLLGQLWILPAGGGEARAITDAVRDTSEDLDPSFSPDGRRVLFQSDRPGGRGLWLIDVSGGIPIRASTGRIPYYARAEAAWAPDGRRFVYVRGGALVIHDVAADSDRVVSVPGLPSVAASSPSWSYDGASIAFIQGGRRPRVWRASVNGSRAEAIGDSSIAPVVASLSPSGDLLALVAPDSLGQPQLWVQRLGGSARRLTAHEDLARHRIRWSSDERTITYSADGRLWRVASEGGAPVEIPFAARVRFVRRTAAPRQLALPEPGSRQRVRGFTGLALSPDAKRIAMLALDSLWVFAPGQRPRAVVATGRSAHDLTWSPDSRLVTWSAGVSGEEDLYFADVTSGLTRRLTGLPGGESMPTWSPDGRLIAFMHAPAAPNGSPSRLRVASSTASLPLTSVEIDSSRSDARDFGPIDGLWMPDQGYVWAPDARAIVTYANPLLEDEQFPARFRLLPLDGRTRTFDAKITGPTYGSWFDSTFTYVEGDRLWRISMTAHGTIGAPHLLGTDPALAASTARDGTVLYLSEDGLRLRRPDGRVSRLGWPIEFRLPSPPPVLVRNVHVIDGTGQPASPLRDLLLQDGRIVRVGTPGSIAAPNAAVVDATGRFAMPGLIDMHAHFFPESPPDGFLYHGVTTARDVGSLAGRTAALRDAIDAGVASGPRIVLGGFLFHTQSGTPNGATGLTDQMVGDSAGLDRAMRLARALGAGYIKHRTFEDWGAGTRTIHAAHRYGLPISGHCVHILPLVAAGIDGKEHSGDCFRDFGRIYSDFTRLYAAAGVWVDPTAGLYGPIVRIALDSTALDAPGIAPWLVPQMRRRYLTGQKPATFERALLLARQRTSAIRAAGVPLIAGTDQGVADGIHWELDALVRAGLTPGEAIVAATSQSARVLGVERELGTIDVGKRADLVIVDGDPSLDIGNTRRIWQVMQGGRIVDRDALLRLAPNGELGALRAASPRLTPRLP